MFTNVVIRKGDMGDTLIPGPKPNEPSRETPTASAQWTIYQVQEFISGNVGIMGGISYFALAIYLPFVTPAFGNNRQFNIGILILIGLVSGMLGWGLGIFLSPIGKQGDTAKALASAVASFWTGVVVSHIERITQFLINTSHEGMSQATKIRLLLGGGVFVMSLFITVNSRFPENDSSQNGQQRNESVAEKPGSNRPITSSGACDKVTW